MDISEEIRQKLLLYQENEITEHRVYSLLAASVKSPENKRVFEKIAQEELQHYTYWRTLTGRDVAPDTFRVWKYFLIIRLLGFTFGAKLMEKGEEKAQVHYGQLVDVIPAAGALLAAEDEHEKAILALLDEETLRYIGSVVLGLNDALVELTGTLAGFTFALQNTALIALTASITGVAAALSMAASEYLSTKSEEPTRNPLKASLYTGVAYLATVLILVLPYLLLDSLYLCLGLALVSAVLIIAAFNYYISVARDLSFRRRFLEMVGLSLGVAVFTFLFGFVVNRFLGVQV